MTEYLEDCDNLIIQVLAEFSIFIYTLSKDSQNSRMLHNVIIESRRLHIRVLEDFFSAKRKNKDDIIFSDLIENTNRFTPPPALDSNVRTLINKHTAHLSKKRGKLSDCSETEMNFYSEYIRAIGDYITVLDENINPKYKDDYYASDARELRNTIILQLMEFYTINSKG